MCTFLNKYCIIGCLCHYIYVFTFCGFVLNCHHVVYSCISDAMRTRETLNVMEEHTPQLSDAEVHFLGSFYSVSAMDGQTAHHLQETICKYARDDMFTVM